MIGNVIKNPFMLCYITHVMFCYITHDILCYITRI